MLFSRSRSKTLSARALASLLLLTGSALGIGIMPSIATEEYSLDANCASASSKTDSPGVTTNGAAAADYTIRVETSLPRRIFEHESFSIKSIVKASVDFYPGLSESCSKQQYEKLWYHDGKALGLERQSSFDIPGDKNVGIKIVQSPCSSIEETKAASNIIMRLALDILRNNDRIAKVSVPSSSYADLLSRFQNRGAGVMPAGEEAPQAARLKFKLESATTGFNQDVYFM